jgi:hypothetical protein
MTRLPEGCMARSRRPTDETIKCHACGLAVMLKGGEQDGWKAVQMDPAQAELRWYCMKPICQYAYATAVQEAQMTWAAAMPVSMPVTDESEVKLYRQVQGHLQRQEEVAPSMDEEDVPPEPREPPPMLLAYETSNVEEAGFKDEEFPYDRFSGKPGEPDE